jgi:hypothetical protein
VRQVYISAFVRAFQQKTLPKPVVFFRVRIPAQLTWLKEVIKQR